MLVQTLIILIMKVPTEMLPHAWQPPLQQPTIFTAIIHRHRNCTTLELMPHLASSTTTHTS